jgi:hypothetical protein
MSILVPASMPLAARRGAFRPTLWFFDGLDCVESRRIFRPDLCWGAAVPYLPAAGCAASATLPGSVPAHWKHDWRAPQADAELAVCIEALPALRVRYHDTYGRGLSQ